MPEASETNNSLRFGTYELSLESRELRKQGVRLRLSGQPIEVLLLLAEQAGRVVSRQELQQKLWPGDSYGDFEHGLNPAFIETVPRRGYRFIAAVKKPATEESSVAAPVVDEAEPRRKGLLRKGVV